MRPSRPLAAVAALVLSLALAACGDQDPPARGRKPVLPVVASPDQPVSYQLADPDCQNTTQPTLLTQTRIRAWDEDEIVDRQVRYPAKVESGRTLTSDAIGETSYDDRMERVCDYEKGPGRYCDDDEGQEKGWSNARDLKMLRICKDDFDYGRRTFEGVALASVNYIEIASTDYKRLAPAGAKPLPQIHLSVLPHFIDYYDNYPQSDGTRVRLKTWITHNMAHFQSPPMIAVFPDTRQDEQNTQGSFWESQFVLAHEFGHHIDFTLNGFALEAMGLGWSPLEHGLVDRFALAQGLSGGSDRAKVHGAVGETFADLTAYYSEGGTGKSMVALPCFGVNRNVRGDAFKNGDDKIMTEDRLGFLLGTFDEGDKTCGEPRYGDIHIAGAIIARTLDEAFGRLLLASGVDEEGDADARYRLTLAWMDRFVEASRGMALTTTGAGWLAPVAQAMRDVTESYLEAPGLKLAPGESTDRVQRDVCRIVAERLPVVEGKPFALAGGGCG